MAAGSGSRPLLDPRASRRGHPLDPRPAVLGAPERRLLRRRRGARDAAPGPAPAPVVTSRATLIDTVAMDGREAAEDWLRSADLEALATDAVARLNRVLHAQRVATADPATREVALSRALVVRIGYGDGEHVADGRWERASELRNGADPGPLRRVSLRPQERLAAVLAGRDPVLACEELALRARSDLDAERWRRPRCSWASRWTPRSPSSSRGASRPGWARASTSWPPIATRSRRPRRPRCRVGSRTVRSRSSSSCSAGSRRLCERGRPAACDRYTAATSAASRRVTGTRATRPRRARAGRPRRRRRA